MIISRFRQATRTAIAEVVATVGADTAIYILDVLAEAAMRDGFTALARNRSREVATEIFREAHALHTAARNVRDTTRPASVRMSVPHG